METGTAPTAPASPSLGPGEGPTVTPLPIASSPADSVVDPQKITVSAPDAQGAVRIVGAPGAVLGGRATQLRLELFRASAVGHYHALHFVSDGSAGEQLLLAYGDIDLLPGGGFPAVALGDEVRVAHSGDFLHLIPVRANLPVGPTIEMPVP